VEARALLPLAAAIAASLLTGHRACGVFQTVQTPPLAVTRFPFTLGEGQQFANLGRQDSGDVAETAPRSSTVSDQGLYLRSMSETEARLIPGSRGHWRRAEANPVFSPDGRSIAFRSGVDSTLKKIAVSGGAAVTICPADPLLRA